MQKYSEMTSFTQLKRLWRNQSQSNTREAGVCQRFSRKVFLKVSQDSQENTYVGVKKDSKKMFSCKHCEILKNNYYFMEHFCWLLLLIQTLLCKIYCNSSFLWPLISRIRTESTILSLCENMQVRKNPCSGIFYTVVICLKKENVAKIRVLL